MKNFKELNELIESTRVQLKTEFFGIDEQIDSIIENIKPWLCFPEILTRPTIINLWGMTGCGKTSLINRLVELLDLKGQQVYFNFAQLDEKSNWEIEDMLNEHVAEMDIKTPIFIYDEFQYAKTINEDGREISKPALKIFWELLDSGKYQNELGFNEKYTIKKLYNCFGKIVNNEDVVIENGQLLKGEKIYLQAVRARNVSSTSWDYINDKYAEEEPATIFATDEKEVIFKILKQHFPERYNTVGDVYIELSKMDKKQIYEYLQTIYKLALRNVTFDFSKSIIFVLGNLDEAYKMVYNSNPDMSADQFHEMSKKISIVRIKNALQARFRIEQIARLGNIHLIYPSFSSETFRKIISKELKEYMKQVEEMSTYKLYIDQSVNDIVYKDSVFPTHGARPIFTSIHEIVKTKLATAFMYAAENSLQYDSLIYKYEDKRFIITFCKNDKEIVDLSLEQNLRVESLRTSKLDDNQTITAVHEAGHAVVGITLTKTLPNKICSTSSDDSMAGFVLEEENDNLDSRQDVINEIALCLAGKCAEKFVFEKNSLLTNGCSMDFSQATSIAAYHIRKCGFGNHLAVNGWMAEMPPRDNKVYDRSNDELIEELLQDCWKLAEKVIKEQEVLLLKMAEYLSTTNVMEKETIKDFVDKYFIGIFEEGNPKLYRNILDSKLKAINNEE